MQGQDPREEMLTALLFGIGVMPEDSDRLPRALWIDVQARVTGMNMTAMMCFCKVCRLENMYEGKTKRLLLSLRCADTGDRIFDILATQCNAQECHGVKPASWLERRAAELLES